ncbi:MAG: DUF429 domain-containing protein [Aureliella sp.]
MMVVGVDGWNKKWVAVELHDGKFHGIYIAETLAEIAQRSEYEVIGIDVPIGLVDAPPRKADAAARELLQTRRSSVFDAPPAFCLSQEVATYSDANRISKETLGRGISAQAFALMSNIREADSVARDDVRVFEVHPELSFTAMNNQRPMPYPKKSWSGLVDRIKALASHDIHLPDPLDGNDPRSSAGRAGADDILDAAAVAWSAQRIAAGKAIALPDKNTRLHRIWY